MKKSTIKRRKRVVPAYPDSGKPLDMSVQPGTSTSPEPTVSAPDEQHMASDTSPAAKRRRPPPTVDYTGYVPQTSLNEAAPISQESTDHVTVQLQRAAAAAGGMELDPALVEAGRRRREHDATAGQQSEDNANGSAWRAERRAQLMREAEVMRAALRAKEREIDDLT